MGFLLMKKGKARGFIRILRGPSTYNLKAHPLSILHGDGTNTVAKKGAMGLATRATSIKKARRSSP
jgi:hypothetical protein